MLNLNIDSKKTGDLQHALNKFIESVSISSKNQIKTLNYIWLDSPLGLMIVMADEEGLYLLEFINRRALEKEIHRLAIALKPSFVAGGNFHINSIKNELAEYFSGNLKCFKTPIHIQGSPFQKKSLARINPHSLWRNQKLYAASNIHRQP